jgi:hypothetical protein
MTWTTGRPSDLATAIKAHDSRQMVCAYAPGLNYVCVDRSQLLFEIEGVADRGDTWDVPMAWNFDVYGGLFVRPVEAWMAVG